MIPFCVRALKSTIYRRLRTTLAQLRIWCFETSFIQVLSFNGSISFYESSLNFSIGCLSWKRKRCSYFDDSNVFFSYFNFIYASVIRDLLYLLWRKIFLLVSNRKRQNRLIDRYSDFTRSIFMISISLFQTKMLSNSNGIWSTIHWSAGLTQWFCYISKWNRMYHKPVWNFAHSNSREWQTIAF